MLILRILLLSLLGVLSGCGDTLYTAYVEQYRVEPIQCSDERDRPRDSETEFSGAAKHGRMIALPQTQEQERNIIRRNRAKILGPYKLAFSYYSKYDEQAHNKVIEDVRIVSSMNVDHRGNVEKFLPIVIEPFTHSSVTSLDFGWDCRNGQTGPGVLCHVTQYRALLGDPYEFDASGGEELAVTITVRDPETRELEQFCFQLTPDVARKSGVYVF